jgi:predicted Zn-dependent protease
MKILISSLLFTALMYSCSSVPITGRKQLSLVSDRDVLTLSLQQYDAFIGQAKLSADAQNKSTVVRVGQNIANAVATYYRAHGMDEQLKNFSWEFNLVNDPQVNAFCMPGGKIVVYAGILPVTKTETGLAVVLGHEVAHALAKHANERMSQQMAVSTGGAALSVALNGKTNEVQQLGNLIFGLGAQYGVMLPFSRKHELEADRMGLILMAIAGYDPREAPAFWQRMAANGSSVPELLSTHPSDEKRVKEIQAYLPEALKYYKAGGAPASSGSLKEFTDRKW